MGPAGLDFGTGHSVSGDDEPTDDVGENVIIILCAIIPIILLLRIVRIL
jgi:hypothetical protein